MNDRIFRKVALDRLASPEHLDQLLPVVDRRGWLALACCFLVIVAAGVWGFAGTISQTVTGTGMLVNGGGVLEVIPTAGGRISEVMVRVGDTVAKGQTVARMTQPELALRLKEGRAALADLQDHHDQMLTNVGQDIPLQQTQLQQQRLAVQKAIRSALNIKRASEQKIATQRSLVKAGLLLKQTLQETMQHRDAALERMQESESQLAQIAVRESESRNHRQEDQSASERKIGEARRAVDDLSRELQAKSEIVSGSAGRVLEILAEPGMMLATGEPVLTLDMSGKGAAPLEAVIFVPSAYGKQILPGMSVLISPTTIKQEEFGMILGQVTSVSAFPTTVKGMQRILKNDKLVSSLAGADAPYEVRAQLISDPTTVSKYRWSSSKGPPERIGSGALATANIAVAHRRPIDLVIPLAREHTGL
jgi:HlyD family secretion protein